MFDIISIFKFLKIASKNKKNRKICNYYSHYLKRIKFQNNKLICNYYSHYLKRIKFQNNKLKFK